MATGVGSANLNSRAAVLCSYMNGMWSLGCDILLSVQDSQSSF